MAGAMDYIVSEQDTHNALLPSHNSSCKQCFRWYLRGCPNSLRPVRQGPTTCILTSLTAANSTARDFHVNFAFCATCVAQNAKITWKFLAMHHHCKCFSLIGRGNTAGWHT